MVQGQGTIIIDMGNSGTRVVVKYGKDGNTGRYHERQFNLSNRFSMVSEDYKPSEDYNEETSTVFGIEAVVDGQPLGGVWANGEVQEREFSVGDIRPSALEKKYSAKTTALTFEVAMLYATRAVMQITRVSDFKQVDITWNVVVLLPPGDLAEGKNKMIDVISSVKHVYCSYPDVDFPIKINKIHVLPEGYCAYMAVIFDRGSIIRPEYQSLIGETTMVIDIGAGTTDIMIIQNKSIIQSTMTTIDRGGNQVSQLVKKGLKLNYGLKLKEVDINKGIISGTVRDGSKDIDIVDIINSAKDSVANSIVNDVRDFFEETEFPIRSIGKLLVCGGGSMSSEDSENGSENIKALSEAIVSQMKTYSPNIELIEIPTTFVNADMPDGTTKKVEKKISPRMLNVIGASILSEALI